MSPQPRPRTPRPPVTRHPRAAGVQRWMVAVWLLAGLAGFAHGVASAGALLDEPGGLAVSRHEAAGRFERDRLRGSFWAPAGSSAQRPAIPLRERAWRPEDPELHLADARTDLR